MNKKFKKWWQENKTTKRNGCINILTDVNTIIEKFGRFTAKMMFIGIILNIIAACHPGFTLRFPTIYGWFDGWLQFGEFVIKTTLKGLYSVFSNHYGYSVFNAECNIKIKEMLVQLSNWIRTLPW